MNIKNWFKPDDWKEVWATTGAWNMTDSFSIKYKEHCSYTILYSKSRNNYKLVCKGYDAKLHPEYTKAVEKLNELINTL